MSNHAQSRGGDGGTLCGSDSGSVGMGPVTCASCRVLEAKPAPADISPEAEKYIRALAGHTARLALENRALRTQLQAAEPAEGSA